MKAALAFHKRGGVKVLSGQILQKTINDINRIIGEDCSVWDANGKCLAFAGAGEQPREMEEQWAFFGIRDNLEGEYTLAIHGQVENVDMVGRLCASQFESLIRAYQEKVDRNRFFQNLLLDNLLLVDVFNQAKKLKIETEKRRIVFLIEPKSDGDNIVFETMRGMYASGSGNVVTSVEERHIVLIKTLERGESYAELNHMAEIIVDTLTAEAMTSVRVAYGTVVEELKDVSQSYKEAGIALDVGRIFYAEKNILAYNQLGIGRLIHQLPASLCEMFLKEVFDDKEVELFDEETLSTVNQFFENNLNISETARQLYVHRNTLVYRLEKIQKMTGLDVRVFEDALTFKIALMVSRHMKFVQSKE